MQGTGKIVFKIFDKLQEIRAKVQQVSQSDLENGNFGIQKIETLEFTDKIQHLSQAGHYIAECQVVEAGQLAEIV